MRYTSLLNLPYLKACVEESLRYLILILVYSINLGISGISIITYLIIENSLRWLVARGLLQQTITWYKIRHAGGQAHYYSNTGTLEQRQVKFDWFRSLCFYVLVGEISSNRKILMMKSTRICNLREWTRNRFKLVRGTARRNWRRASTLTKEQRRVLAGQARLN